MKPPDLTDAYHTLLARFVDILHIVYLDLFFLDFSDTTKPYHLYIGDYKLKPYLWRVHVEREQRHDVTNCGESLFED